MDRELTNNVKTVLKSANLIYKSGDYTSTTILYFKAMFIVLDLIILSDTGKTPKDHTERFRVLELKYPTLYNVLDKYFKIYRATYSTSIDKETCEDVKKNVDKIIKEFKIEI